MKRNLIALSICATLLLAFVAVAANADPQVKVTICHKYGQPAENTLTIGYPAAMSHIREHGDFYGACPVNDRFIDVDGIATPGRGIPQGINVQIGSPLTAWPTGFGSEGIDWFDNDGTCTWTFGDDLHLEDPGGACSTGFRDGLHNLGLDCVVLDLDTSFADGQQVDVDLESGTVFTGCPGPDPMLMFYDGNGDLLYNDGEDIVLDGNGDGVFN